MPVSLKEIHSTIKPSEISLTKKENMIKSFVMDDKKRIDNLKNEMPKAIIATSNKSTNNNNKNMYDIIPKVK
jgi:hypothetical protein